VIFVVDKKDGVTLRPNNIGGQAVIEGGMLPMQQNSLFED